MADNRSQAETEFFNRWGVAPESRTTTGPTSESREIPVADFMKRWSVAPEAVQPAKVKREDQRSYGTKLNAQVVGGMPIIGPLMNKAVAATGAAITPIFGKEKDTTFGQRYDRNLAEIRGDDKVFADKNPIAATAANVVGGGLATAPLAGTAIGARMMGLTGPSVGARMYQGAAGGALIGGADAALRGENALTGAELGGAMGIAAPVIGHGIERGVSGVANYMFPRTGPLQGTNSVARNWLQSAIDGETPTSIAAARNRMGPAGVFADLNPALTDIAGGVADIPGPGKSLIRQTYRDRQHGQRDRIDDAITEALGPRVNLADLTRSDKSARKAAADPLYEAWRDTAVHPTPQLKELGGLLEKEGFFGEANRLLAADGKPTYQNFFTPGERKNYPTAEAWDYVKQSIDGKIRTARRAGEDNSVRVYTNLKNRLVNAIDNHPNPDVAGVWQQAREAWANPTAIMEAREAGQGVWKRGVRGDELGYELTDMTGPERAAFRQGARDELGQLMDSSVRGDTSVRNMLMAPANQEKLLWLSQRHGYNPQQLSNRLEQEVTNANTYQNVVGGSQTTPKKERVNALLPSPIDDSYFRQLNITQPMTFIPDAIRPQTIFEGARNERYANAARQVAPILMTPRGPEMDTLLQALVAEQQRQAAARGVGSRLGAMATGAIAGQEGTQNQLLRN